MKSNIHTPSAEEAEEAAIAMLAWLAGRDELMTRFLAISGLTADGLRAASAEASFLAGVMDFVMAHEPTLIAFATDSGRAPAFLVACHHVMNGGEANPWL